MVVLSQKDQKTMRSLISGKRDTECDRFTEKKHSNTLQSKAVLSTALRMLRISFLQYNSDLFWNHTWQSAQWRALCTEFIEVNLSAFVCRLFHGDFSFLEIDRTIS